MAEQSVELILLTPQMIVVMGILLFTVVLFAFEVFRVDVVAILILVIIGLSSLVPGYPGLLSASDLFSGFSSNAVLSIIAIMILGAGLDKTGALNRLASQILRFAGDTERTIMIILSGTVGWMSGFIQNIGAAALFLPVANRIAKQTGVSANRLLMPMGFCAILGGTLTMVGSSPLILLNDLIDASSSNLPSSVGELRTFSLFSVTPIGITLLVAGISFFFLFGRFVLPSGPYKALETGAVTSYFKDTYGISGRVYELYVPRESSIVGKTVQEIEDVSGYDERIIAIYTHGNIIVEPGRSTKVMADSHIAIMGRYDQIVENVNDFGIELKDEISIFQEMFNPSSSGIAEVVIPPSSPAIGKSMTELGSRKNYGTTIIAIYRNERPIRKDVANVKVRAGDSLIVHCLWSNLQRFAKALEIVVVSDFPREDYNLSKFYHAMAIFGVTLSLVLFSNLKLSLSLMTGAILMILAGVIKIEEAYRSIGWQSVFLLACLLPLGLAVEQTQTALWIAQNCVMLLEGVPITVYMIVMGVLATIFSLLISNVGATVLLVPIAINVAVSIGADPTIFALIVAVSTSNSFVIPTHQVNALIHGPGGYRVSDFMRAGSVMSILFLGIVILMVQVFYV